MALMLETLPTFPELLLCPFILLQPSGASSAHHHGNSPEAMATSVLLCQLTYAGWLNGYWNMYCVCYERVAVTSEVLHTHAREKGRDQLYAPGICPKARDGPVTRMPTNPTTISRLHQAVVASRSVPSKPSDASPFPHLTCFTWFTPRL